MRDGWRIRLFVRLAWFLVGVVGTACNRGLDLETSPLTEQSPWRNPEEPLVAEGRQAYRTYCAGCHGDTGDGRGPAAGFLRPRPRNFQRTLFKFSSTRAGQLPTDADLVRTIRRGLRGSAMPDWPMLSERTVLALIAYIKTFSPRWRENPPVAPVAMVEDPYRGVTDKSEAIRRGEMVYHGYANCWSCHPAYVPELTINDYLEALGRPRREGFRPGLFDPEPTIGPEGEINDPPDFRRDLVRGGTSADDLYRSIAAGLTGTAMSPWVEAMDFKSADGRVLVQPADLWAMVYYVRFLLQQRPPTLAPEAVVIRHRPQTLYFHGDIPPPAQKPTSVGSGEVFEEN